MSDDIIYLFQKNVASKHMNIDIIFNYNKKQDTKIAAKTQQLQKPNIVCNRYLKSFYSYVETIKDQKLF